MSFANSVTVLGDAPPPVHSPEGSVQELLPSAVAEEDVMDTEGGAMDSKDAPAPIKPPPPGFRQFSWPNEYRSVSDDPSLFTFMKELPGWFPWNSGVLPVDMPSLPLSPIVPEESIVQGGVDHSVGSCGDWTSCWGCSSRTDGCCDPGGLTVAHCCRTVVRFTVGTGCYGCVRPWRSALSKQGLSMAAGLGRPISGRVVACCA